MDYSKELQKSLEWVERNSVENNGGIAVTDKNHKLYPEVTGYFIPSLLRMGEKKRAISYAKHLMELQKEDGSWWDSDNQAPYVFDSAQILKGLISIREFLPEADNHIIKGVDWILSNMQSDGRLTTPDTGAWGSDDYFCNELIHVYCLSPIKEAGKVLYRPDYIEKSEKILDYYIDHYRERIVNFTLFAHFYAYVMEGLIDMGRPEISKEAMSSFMKYVSRDGAVRALNNVSWVCSTSMFQMAIVWYKLGEKSKGDKTFEYTLHLQNSSGGWFGSYPTSKLNSLMIGKKRASYFPDEEISWAVKFFWDALYYKDGKDNTI